MKIDEQQPPTLCRGIIYGRINRQSNIDVKNAIIPVVADSRCYKRTFPTRKRATRAGQTQLRGSAKRVQRHAGPLRNRSGAVMERGCYKRTFPIRKRATRAGQTQLRGSAERVQRHAGPLPSGRGCYGTGLSWSGCYKRTFPTRKRATRAGQT